VSGTSNTRLCNEVFDAYLAHCEARLQRGDMAGVTVTGYRKVIDGVWRPHLGKLVFSQVRYSRLIGIADGYCWSKKTYNNAVSVLKRAFDFGYRDRPFHENPALNLRCARLKKADRPKVDPFCAHDAEMLIAGIHRDWGEAQGNYDEFRFFTGLRPSEQIALVLDDVDLVNGVISINKARVSGVDRCQTKTGEDRRVHLCPRALSVLKRHLCLRARMKAEGKVHHDHVFFLDTGEPFWTLHHPQVRWRTTLQSLKLRYRRPYTARQTSVSWDLMIGKNPLWVAKQHGHSIATMLRAYAAWAEGVAEIDVEAIKRSKEQTVPLPTENLAVDLPVGKEVQTLSAPLPAPTGTPDSNASPLNQQDKMEEKSSALCGWGGRIRTSEWRDQNIWTSIINKLLILLTGWSPLLPSIPPRCHQSCHQP
jgi:integrase